MVIRARNRVANNNLSFLFCELSFHTLGKDSVLHCPLLTGLWDFRCALRIRAALPALGPPFSTR